MMKRSVFVLSILLILTIAFAGNYRINGMGGAGLALINDIKTITYNPSLMSNSGFLNLRILGLDMTANSEMLNLLQQLSKDATVSQLIADLSSNDENSNDKLGDDLVYILNNYSKYLNGDLSFGIEANSGLILNLAVAQVGVGANLKAKALMNFDTANLAVDTFNVNVKSRIGIALSTGLPFIKVGVGLYDELSTGYDIPQGTSVTDLATQLANPPLIQHTVSGDLSGTLQLGAFRLSAVSRNVFSSDVKYYRADQFGYDITLQDAENMLTHLTFNASDLTKHLDVGMAFVVRGFAMSAEVDDFQGFMNILSNGPSVEDPSLVKHLHFGIEKQILPILTVRAGLNQGYLTFGGDIFLLLGKIGFAYYGSEGGMLAGDQLRQNFEMHVDILF